MTADARLLLLDTASLYFRAFYGVPDSLRAPDGRPVNAVRGLLDFISRFVTEYRPTHLACCWDNDWRPSWRVDLVPSYKAHRVAGPETVAAGTVVGAGGVGAQSGIAEEAPDALEHQVPLIVATLAALGLPIVGVDGYEADDVIGTLATRAAEQAIPTEVVTGDRDLFQLVDDAARARVLYVARGVAKHERIDGAWVRQKYGIDPAQYVDFAVLRGDPSDGLPGVAGIGEKTATGLLDKYGSLEAILQAASQAPSPLAAGVRSKLEAAIDYLGPATEVVAVARDIDTGVDVADLALVDSPADPEAWQALVADLGLGSSAERIEAALALGRD